MHVRTSTHWAPCSRGFGCHHLLLASELSNTGNAAISLRLIRLFLLSLQCNWKVISLSCACWGAAAVITDPKCMPAHAFFPIVRHILMMVLIQTVATVFFIGIASQVVSIVLLLELSPNCQQGSIHSNEATKIFAIISMWQAVVCY